MRQSYHDHLNGVYLCSSCHKPRSTTGQTKQPAFGWSSKQKRAFHRIKSGVTVAHLKKTPIKHLMLSSSPEGGRRNISTDFQILRKRIYRKFGVLLQYAKVHTSEGHGVLHILYREKQYLPQRWLSDQWLDIHKSSYVWIKQPPPNVARYIVTQYLAGQGTSFQRCSYSLGWVCRGFVKAWKFLLSNTKDVKHATRNFNGDWNYPIDFKRALSLWDDWLYDVTFCQSELIPF
jgi:hypothetical protein